MSIGFWRPLTTISWFPLLKLKREMLVVCQSVQYNVSRYTASPYGWILTADDIINCLFLPLRSDTSILSSLASTQNKRFVSLSIVSPFGQTRFRVTMVRLAEPSISACSILGLAPQSVQYIMLKVTTNTLNVSHYSYNYGRSDDAKLPAII